MNFLYGSSSSSYPIPKCLFLLRFLPCDELTAAEYKTPSTTLKRVAIRNSNNYSSIASQLTSITCPNSSLPLPLTIGTTYTHSNNGTAICATNFRAAKLPAAAHTILRCSSEHRRRSIRSAAILQQRHAPRWLWRSFADRTLQSTG